MLVQFFSVTSGFQCQFNRKCTRNFSQKEIIWRPLANTFGYTLAYTAEYESCFCFTSRINFLLKRMWPFFPPFPELHVRYLLLLSSVEGFSSLSSHKLSIRAPLTVQNLIYTQLKTGSKLRLEREEDSSTERKTFNCEFGANARSFHEHITLNRSKRKITLVGSQARNSE